MFTLSLGLLGLCSSVTLMVSGSAAQTSMVKQVPGTNISIGQDNYLFGNLFGNLSVFSGSIV